MRASIVEDGNWKVDFTKREAKTIEQAAAIERGLRKMGVTAGFSELHMAIDGVNSVVIDDEPPVDDEPESPLKVVHELEPGKAVWIPPMEPIDTPTCTEPVAEPKTNGRPVSAR